MGKNELKYFLLIIIFQNAILINIITNQLISHFSIIQLEIQGKGFQKLFHESNKYPDLILINGINQNNIINIYELNETNNEIKLIWNESTSNCEGLFKDCLNITEIDFSDFDTSIVTDMSYMFSGCSLLSSLNLSNFNTYQVQYMGSMFYECSSLSSLNLSDFDTSKVISMSSMFSGCSSLTSLILSNFNTSQTLFMYNMFSKCSSLTYLNLYNFDTSGINDMDQMFSGCSSLISLNISNFDTSKVITMYAMFDGCSSLLSLNLFNFNTSLVTIMNYMFTGNSLLNYLNITSFDTSQVTNMLGMFMGCSSLSYLNLSNFKTNKAINMCRMFYDCFSLIDLNLTSFDTSLVTDMNGMFKGCSLLKSLNLFYFNTSQVEDMSYMFYNCSSLSSLNISNFDTSKVIKMNSMFSKCQSLSTLNLSFFDTSHVANMGFMFSDSSSLEFLNLSNFNTFQVMNLDFMFIGCNSLFYLDLSNFISGTNNIFQKNYYNLKLKYLNLNNSELPALFPDIKNIYDIITKNAILCINKNDESFLSYFPINYCITFNCSKNWSHIKPKLTSNDNCFSDYEVSNNEYENNEECNEACPNGTKMIKSNENEYICARICKNEKPFFNIVEKKCVFKCNIKDIFDRKCIVYLEEKNKSNNNYYEANLLLNCILDDIINIDIYQDLFNKQKNISIEENGFICEIKKVDKNDINILDNIFGNCQSSFPDYSNYINYIKSIYLLKLNIIQEEINESKIVYELYYSLNNDEILKRIDLSILDDNCYLKSNISKCASYSIESIINNTCLSCENNYGYYSLEENIDDSYIECIKNPIGYYLDKENKVYKKCYYLCKTCNISGSDENPNCLEHINIYRSNIIKSTNIDLEEYITDNNEINISYRNNINSIFIPITNGVEGCYKNNTKLIPMNNICISDCSHDEIYKYEFNNTCYEQCPNNTIKSKKNEFICELIFIVN